MKAYKMTPLERCAEGKTIRIMGTESKHKENRKNKKVKRRKAKK